MTIIDFVILVASVTSGIGVVRVPCAALIHLAYALVAQ